MAIAPLMRASNTPGATGASAPSSTSSQDLAQTFLQLLVAQLNNQDPLNPVDNSQLTTQMAQISTVTGINTLNNTVNGLMTQLRQSAALQSAQLTGHSVMVAGSSLQLVTNATSSGTAGTGLSAVGGYNLGANASSVTVTVKDAAGNTVRTISEGAQSGGFQVFTWDGKTDAGKVAPAGSYQFSVSASNSSGTVSTTSYKVMTVVGSVPQSDGSIELMLSDGSQVSYSAIKQFI